MICNLAVYITDLSLVDEAVSIVNYETFQCFSIIHPLHFLYSLQLIRCTNNLQSRLHQRAIINLRPDTTTKYQNLCSTLPLPKPLPNTILSQLHLPLSLKSYLPNIQLRHESPTSDPRYCSRPHL
jgi:hypothetical protein